MSVPCTSARQRRVAGPCNATSARPATSSPIPPAGLRPHRLQRLLPAGDDVGVGLPGEGDVVALVRHRHGLAPLLGGETFLAGHGFDAEGDGGGLVGACVECGLHLQQRVDQLEVGLAPQVRRMVKKATSRLSRVTSRVRSSGIRSTTTGENCWSKRMADVSCMSIVTRERSCGRCWSRGPLALSLACWMSRSFSDSQAARRLCGAGGKCWAAFVEGHSPLP